MNLIAAQEIKRRGVSALDRLLTQGPVRIVKNNRPSYVVMTELEYETMTHDLAEARLAAAEADLKAGRIRKGSSADLMVELLLRLVAARNITDFRMPYSRRTIKVGVGCSRPVSFEASRIGPNDLIIAATALAHHALLVTANVSEFSRVPGLRVEDWRQQPSL